MIGALVQSFPSRTSAGVTHDVRRGRDGVLYCTCPSWRFQESRAPHRRTNCRHIRAVLDGKDRAEREAMQPRQVEMFARVRAKR